jgi:hypothetical protein
MYVCRSCRHSSASLQNTYERAPVSTDTRYTNHISRGEYRTYRMYPRLILPLYPQLLNSDRLALICTSIDVCKATGCKGMSITLWSKVHAVDKEACR